MEKLDSYVMAMCSPDTKLIFRDDGKVDAARLDNNIEEYCARIMQATTQHAARIVAFPQFGLTGYARVSTEDWLAASIDLTGPEVGVIAESARAAGSYVVVQIPERHSEFPGRYFLSAVLLTPEGKVGLVHRKHYTLSLRTSPIDIYDRFVKVFGRDALFPVLDTPIGRLGLLIGGEVYWPEAVRSLALQGAEVVVNTIAAGEHVDYMKRPGADIVRSARAFENLIYLGMVNMQGENAATSRIHDYDGGSIGQTVGEGGVFTLATIDLAAQRAARAAPAANFLAQLQPAIHDDIGALDLWPQNAFAAGSAERSIDLAEVEAQSWDRLQEHWRSRKSV